MEEGAPIRNCAVLAAESYKSYKMFVFNTICACKMEHKEITKNAITYQKLIVTPIMKIVGFEKASHILL